MARDTQRLSASLPAGVGWNAWQAACQEVEGELGYAGLFSTAGFPQEDALLRRVKPAPATLQRLRTACTALAAGTDSPSEALSGAYQSLLRFKPELESCRFRLIPARAGRKAGGTFYTPRPLARVIVDETLSRLPAVPFRIFDPAMGAGVFLLETARWLACRGQQPADAAERRLFGADCDPLAVELAILSLWFETGARPFVLAQHLRRADSLDGDGPSEPFDAVIGNPPWGVRIGATDSFKLFLGLAVARTRGAVGIVMPQAILSQTTHADARNTLLSRLDPYAALLLGDRRFGGAAAPACALIFGPKPGPSCVRVADCRGRAMECPVEWRNVDRDRWTTGHFPLHGCDVLDLLHRLQRRHARLGDMRHLYRVRDTGINYSHAAVARRSLYVGTEPDDPRDIPRFRGRDFTFYSTVRQGGWLRHDVEPALTAGEHFSFGWSTWRASEKIVVRQTADRIIATLDRSGMAMGRSVIAITAEAGVSLPALLACLNSRLLTVLYRSLAGEKGRIMPQVKVARLHDLPIPVAWCIDVGTSSPAAPGTVGSHAAMIWTQLHDLVLDVLEAGGSSPEVDNLIDGLIYELYALTADEIALVESA